MTAHSFSLSKRLRNSSEFDAVFKQPTRRVSHRAFLFLAKHSESPVSRLGLVVGKRTAQSSVARNRLKRLIRESFRTEFNQSSMDVVVLARPVAANLANEEILEILGKQWTQLNAR